MNQPNMSDVIIRVADRFIVMDRGAIVAHRHHESQKGDISQPELQQALLDAVGGGR